MVVFGHPEGTWCGDVLIILRGPVVWCLIGGRWGLVWWCFEHPEGTWCGLVFGHPEGTWCGFVWSLGRGEVSGVLNMLRGPGVVAFGHPEGTWCGGVWSS